MEIQRLHHRLFPLIIILIISLTTACRGGNSDSASLENSSDSSDNSYSSLSLGDVQPIAFNSEGKATLSFGDNNSDTYMIILNATSTTDSAYTVQMSSSAASSVEAPISLPALAVVEEEEDENPMHGLMEVAAIMASESFESIPESSFQAATVVEQLEVGSTRTFKVLNSLSSISSYEVRDATLRYASEDVYIYVDQEIEANNPEDITDTDIEVLAAKFEDQIVPINQNLFGVESDVDGDGHKTIFINPILNQMSGTGGIVTGFFFPGDLYDYISSNGMEIFYVLAPDSNGIYGPRLTRTFVQNNIWPGVLAHEYQHMISFNTHVFLFGGSTEKSWLNEALSHFAEDITGFGTENCARLKLFLQATNSTPVASTGIPTLAERGAGYAFIRYLYEQATDGDAFISRMLLTDNTGVQNVEAAFESSDPSFTTFSDFLTRLSVTLALSGTGMTPDPRYNYEARTINSATNNYQGLCIRCDTQDGRGTILNGPSMTASTNSPNGGISVAGSSAQFIELSQPDDTISINGNSQAGMAGSVIHYVSN